MKKYFFEISVYRISEAAYRKQMDNYLRRNLQTYDGVRNSFLQSRKAREIHPNEMLAGIYSKEYGGPWRYNEIIGYLRLYLFGNQIRVEYWQVQAKRIVKSRKKLFGRKSPKVVDEVTVKDVTSNNKIKEAVEAAVKSCEVKFRERCLDLHYFNAVKDHVNWVNFIANV